MSFRIELEGDRRVYAPREVVRGVARFDRKASAVKLVVHVKGKKADDTWTEDELSLEGMAVPGEVPFALKLPAQPRSFEGGLFTISWTVELETEVVPIVVRL